MMGNQQGHAVVEDVEPTTKEVEVVVEEYKVDVEADPFVDVHARPTNALIRVRHDNEWHPNMVRTLVLAHVAIEDIVDDRAPVQLIGEIKFPKHDDGEGCAIAEEVDKGLITMKATNEPATKEVEVAVEEDKAAVEVEDPSVETDPSVDVHARPTNSSS
ncbi:hypothetical protein Ancab_035786 [Ancistrocladus abbreviatus]